MSSSSSRSVRVPAELAGRPLDAVVRALFEASWGKARGYIETGKITVDGAVVEDGLRPMRAGAEVRLDMQARRPRPERELPRGAIVYVDAHVVVVDKPSGISTVPYEDERGTLDERVRAFLEAKEKTRGARPALGVVHRIDKETSGIVVFTRTWLAKKSLSSQFRAHTTFRRYVAIVHGEAEKGTIRSHLVEDRGDGVRGSWELTKSGRMGRKPPPTAQLAVTHVDVLEPLKGATLVECRLETGRTHQIRIHLSERGNPLVGERVYVRGFEGERIPAPRLMLHAAELGFVHPATQREMRFSREVPEDMARVLEELRG
jgi:23S rRNA pseudouridine1911/1915/1917 synthase